MAHYGSRGWRLNPTRLRWELVVGLWLITFAAAVGALAALNTLVWQYTIGVGDYAVLAMSSLVVGALLVGDVALSVRRGARLGGRITGWRWVSAALGAAILAWGTFVTGNALWFDLTFIESGRIGASLAVLGVWLAMFLALPLEAILLAAAPRSEHAPQTS